MAAALNCITSKAMDCSPILTVEIAVSKWAGSKLATGVIGREISLCQGSKA